MAIALAVESTILQFYSSQNESLRQELHDRLTTIQNDHSSWDHITVWLQPDKPVEVQFFAANCLYHKLTKQWSPEVFPDHLSLPHTIISLLLSGKYSNVICTRLCSCLAVYILQTVPDIWPDPFLFLSQSLSTHSFLTDILTCIPHEFKKFPGGIERRSIARSSLSQDASKVASFLFSCLTSPPIDPQLESVLDCVEGWISFGSPLSDWSDLILHFFTLASKSDQCLPSLSKFFCYLVETTDLNKLDLFLSRLTLFCSQILIPCAQRSAREESESLWRMIFSFSQHQSVYLLSNISTPEVQTIMLACFSISTSPLEYPKEESCSNLSFGFWTTMCDEITLLPQEKRPSAEAFLKDIYSGLSRALLNKARFPKETSVLTAEEREEFEQYRVELGDVFCACYKCSPALQTWYEELLKEMSIPGSDWRGEEACLFAFLSVADVQMDTQIVKALFEICVPKLRLNDVRIYSTTLSLVSSYAHVLVSEGFEPVAEIVLRGMQEDSTCMRASIALKDVLRSRSKNMLAITPRILEVCYGSVENSSLKGLDRIRIVECIGYLLSIQSNELILDQLTLFLTPRLERIQNVLEGGSISKERLLEELAMISALIGSLDTKSDDAEIVAKKGELHPVALIMQHSFELFQRLYLVARDQDVAVKVCETVRKSLATLLGDADPLLEKYCECVLVMFPPRIEALGLAKQLFLVFGNDAEKTSLRTLLDRLVDLVAPSFVSQGDIDVVEEFLLVMEHVLRKNPNTLCSDRNINERFLSLLHQAICFPEASVIKRATSSLCAMLKTGAEKEFLRDLIGRRGGEVFLAAFVRLQTEPLSACVECLAELLFDFAKYSEFIAGWMHTLPQHPLVSTLFKEKNKRRFKEMAKQMNYNSRRESN